MSLKDQILAAKELERTPIKVKDWPNKLFVRKLSGAEIELHEKKLTTDDKDDKDDKVGWVKRMAYWIAVCLVDDNGNLIFSADNAIDIAGLMSLPFNTLEEVSDKATTLNGLTKESTDNAKKN